MLVIHNVRTSAPLLVALGVLQLGCGKVEMEAISGSGGKPGVIHWQRTFEQRNVASGLAIDGHSRILLTGGQRQTDSEVDVFLAQLDPNGQESWSATIAGSVSGTDYGRAIATDEADNAYVTGSLVAAGGLLQTFVQKYDAAGNKGWFVQLAPGAQHEAFDVKHAPRDGLVVTGYESTVDQGYQIWTGGFDEQGTPTWSIEAGGPGIDVGLALDVDATGAAWVGGYSTLTVGRDAWIGKYSASGEQLWASTFDFSPGRDDLSQAIASDPSGGIYAGGYETDSTELPHAWVRRYDSSGNVLWTKSSVLPGEVRSLAVDAKGDVFLCGYVSTGVDKDAWLEKRSSDGEVVWSAYHDEHGEPDECYSVAVDRNDGSIVVGGYVTRDGAAQTWVQKRAP